MAEQTTEESYNKIYSNNMGFNNASALQIRLDCSQIIEQVELFLKGKKILCQTDSDGNMKVSEMEIGKPRANEIGIQSILNWLQLILNTQVVQGNFPSESNGHSSMYDDYICMVRADFSSILMTNLYKWEIDEYDFDFIVDSIMNNIEPFITRLIDNKERESFENTIRTNENNTIREPKDKIKLLGG